MLKKAAAAALLVVIALLVTAIINELPTASAKTIMKRGCGDPNLIASEPPQDTATPIEMLDAEDVGTTISMTVSGYTSDPKQTDSTPCIASDGSDICERKARNELICAASREFPLGTKLRIPGLGTCTVADYMPADRVASADWYFGKDADGSKTKFNKAMRIDKKIPRLVTIVSVPQ